MDSKTHLESRRCSKAILMYTVWKKQKHPKKTPNTPKKKNWHKIKIKIKKVTGPGATFGHVFVAGACKHNANTMWRKLLYSGFHTSKAVTYHDV